MQTSTIEPARPSGTRSEPAATFEPGQVLEAMHEAMCRATRFVPADVRRALEQSVQREVEVGPRLHILTSLENFQHAADSDGLVCTDTGWPCFYLVIGDNVRISGGVDQLESLACEAVRRATGAGRMRPTMTHPLTRAPLGDNCGLGFPALALRFDRQLEGIRIIAVPKGGGGDVFGADYRFVLAADGLAGVKKFIIDSYAASAFAGKTCPPNIVGIGLGGTPDAAMTLAKQASTLRLVGDRHPDSSVAQLELALLEGFNDLGIGPMGGGGITAALDVHVELAATHPAGTAVAIAPQCHIGRRAVVMMHADGRCAFEDDPRWFREDRIA